MAKAKLESINNKIDSLSKKQYAMKFIVIIESVIILLLLVINIYIASLPKSVPYVIEITTEGKAKYVNDAVKQLNNWTPKGATVDYFLTEFIKNVRSSSIDKELTKINLLKAYSVVQDVAYNKLNDYIKENNPLTREKTTKVEVYNISPISSTSYQIDWYETNWSYNKLRSDGKYRAIVHTKFYRPATEQQKTDNPIGLYIMDYDITKIKTK